MDQNFAAMAKERRVMLLDKVHLLSVVDTLQNVQNKTLSQLSSLLIFGAEDLLTDFHISELFPRGQLLNVLDQRGAPLE